MLILELFKFPFSSVSQQKCHKTEFSLQQFWLGMSLRCFKNNLGHPSGKDQWQVRYRRYRYWYRLYKYRYRYRHKIKYIGKLTGDLMQFTDKVEVLETSKVIL